MIARALFSLKGLVDALIVLCLWLGLLTHYALSVVEEASAAGGGARRLHGSKGAANAVAPEIGGGVERHGEQQSSPMEIGDARRAVVTLELQLAILKRKLADAISESGDDRRKIAALEDALSVCRQQSPPPPPATPTWAPPVPPQYPNIRATPLIAAEEPPSGLDEYEKEQWRIRKYMREQREAMLRDRRDFVRDHQPPASAAPHTQMPPRLGKDASRAPVPQQVVVPRAVDGGGPSGWATEPQSIGLSQHRDHLASLVRAHGPIIPVVVVAYQRAPILRQCIDTILRRMHYQFILEEVFAVPGYERIIFVEEDIEVGVDFFEYMTALSPLLDQDPTLYCVSAWNDNGKATHIADPRALYRTDFFPGLGWMMARSLWLEFQSVWPNGFWDDWLRQPQHRKGRSCIRPEVPRSFTWCTSEGVSQGQFCAEHLANIKLADTAIAWAAENLSVLVKDAYDQWLQELLATATEVRAVDELDRVHVPASRKMAAVGPLNQPLKEVKLIYRSNQEFEHLAQQLNLMDDFKDNVPRTAYKGVVTFRRRSIRVHLVSEAPLYK